MLGSFLEDKWGTVFYIWIVRIVVSIFLLLAGTKLVAVFLMTILYLLCDFLYFIVKYKNYVAEKKKADKIIENLDRHYYIHELIKRPKNGENAIYYDLMKLSNQDMVREIREKSNKLQEFRELIEEYIHEMKTPLTSIELISESFQNKTDLKIEVSRLEDILALCLTVIRMESLEKDYHLDNINISNLIHEIILEEKQQVRQKNIVLNISISPNSIVKSDEKWVAFILKQIIVNAIKYVEIDGKIEIFEEVKNFNYLLHIRDNGIGIPESDLPRVFERGFTGSKVQRQSASGLGLYLSKTCADKMNIKIDIESEYKKYTQVTLAFPQEREPFQIVS